MQLLFFLTNYPGYGGIERVTTILANELTRQGVGVSILSAHNLLGKRPEDLHQSVALHHLPRPKCLLSGANKRFLRRLLDETPYDYVIYQDSYIDTHRLLTAIGYPCKKRLVVVEHNSPLCREKLLAVTRQTLPDLPLVARIRKSLWYLSERVQEPRRFARRHRRLMEDCRHYVLLSENFKPELTALMGNVDFSRVSVIGNPLTLEPEVRAEAVQGKELHEIVFVGRLVRQKGIHYLLNIWQQFVAKHPDYHLTIVGDGLLRPLIEKSISEGLKNVCLVGAQDDIAPYYERASVVMMTSVFEGFGLVLTEAMSRGCIPIAFDSYASLRDIITPDVNGCIVSPFDTDAYVAALSRLVSLPPAELQAMQQAALDKAETFRVRNIARQWIELLS